MNPPVPPRVPLHPQAPGENREAARPVSPDAQAPPPGTPGPASPSAASGEAAARQDTGPKFRRIANQQQSAFVAARG